MFLRAISAMTACVIWLTPCHVVAEIAKRNVLIEEVRLTEHFTDQIREVGTSIAPDRVMITTKIDDRIESIHFSDGQTVAEGDVLVRLSSDEESAEVKALEAQVRNQEKIVKRQMNLKKSGYTYEQQLDQAKTELDVLEQNLHQARARLDEHAIVAPFEGRLGLKQVSVGQYLEQGDPIVSLVKINPMYIDFSMPERLLGLVTPGSEILIRDGQEREYKAVVIALDNEINPATRALAIRAQVDNSDGSIVAGQLFNVTLEVLSRAAILIPEKSVVQQRNQHFVFVVDGNTVKKTDIQVGSRRPGVVEVVQGLTPGQRIVVEGIRGLQDGDQVNHGNSPLKPATPKA